MGRAARAALPFFVDRDPDRDPDRDRDRDDECDLDCDHDLDRDRSLQAISGQGQPPSLSVGRAHVDRA